MSQSREGGRSKRAAESPTSAARRRRARVAGAAEAKQAIERAARGELAVGASDDLVTRLTDALSRLDHWYEDEVARAKSEIGRRLVEKQYRRGREQILAELNSRRENPSKLTAHDFLSREFPADLCCGDEEADRFARLAHDAIFSGDPNDRMAMRILASSALNSTRELPAALRAWLWYVLQRVKDLPHERDKGRRPKTMIQQLAFQDRLAEFLASYRVCHPKATRNAQIEEACKQFLVSYSKIERVYDDPEFKALLASKMAPHC